jgi:hypothetical protein
VVAQALHHLAQTLLRGHLGASCITPTQGSAAHTSTNRLGNVVDRSPEWLAKHYKRLRQLKAEQKRDLAKVKRIYKHLDRRGLDIDLLEEYGRTLEDK